VFQALMSRSICKRDLRIQEIQLSSIESASDLVNVEAPNGFGPMQNYSDDINGESFETISNDPESNLQLETEKLKTGLYILYIESSGKVTKNQYHPLICLNYISKAPDFSGRFFYFSEHGIQLIGCWYSSR
jgi:hypothetical protein